MFGVGAQEMMLIGLLCLVVFGPGKLPGMARDLGGVVRKLRVSVDEFKSEIAPQEDWEDPYENPDWEGLHEEFEEHGRPESRKLEEGRELAETRRVEEGTESKEQDNVETPGENGLKRAEDRSPEDVAADRPEDDEEDNPQTGAIGNSASY